MFEFSLIGAGKMAREIGQRIIQYGGMSPSSVIASHYDFQKALEFQKKTGIQTTTNNKEAVELSRVVILCVTPQKIEEVIQEITPAFCTDKILVNIVVGTKLSWLAKKIGTYNIVNFHPSSALMITEQWNPGISLWNAHSKINNEQHEALRKFITTSIGELWIISQEEQLPPLIFVAGNSPAYILRIIKAFVDCIKIEIDDVDPIQLYKTIIKALHAGIVLESKVPEQIIKQIATNQGITQSGLDFLEKEIDPLIKDLFNTTINRIKAIEHNILKN